MRVWLIKAGEPLPLQANRNARLLRTGQISSVLAARGHSVVWWSSTFDHARKAFLMDRPGLVEVSPSYHLRLLHGIGYRRNVSPQRVINHWQISRQFAVLARREAEPDVVLCALPTPDLARQAVEYCVARSVPIVIDLRDMWPDIIVDVAPRWLRPVGRFALKPMFDANRLACSQATALVGITDEFLEWGLSYAGRQRGPLDRVFPLAYPTETPSADDIARARAEWEATGVRLDGRAFLVCFFGAIGRHSDLTTVVYTARQLAQDQRDIRFIVCGRGDDYDRLKALASGLPNVVMPGWVGNAQIWALMQASAVGLAPYRDTFSYRASIPNKAVEYLSAGLPVLSSLPGRLERLLTDRGCGITYRDGDAQDLRKRLIELYDQPGYRRALGAAARSTFDDQFRADRVYGAFADHLERLAASKVERASR